MALLAAIAVGSLCVAAYSHYKAEREKQRQKLVRLHSRQLGRLTQAISALDVADEEAALAEELNQFRLSHARALVDCDPQSRKAHEYLTAATHYRHQRTRLDDAELNLTQVKAGLEEAGSLWRELHGREQITQERLQEIQAHLRKTRVLLDVQVIEDRARARLEQGNRRQAARDYRNALSLLYRKSEETGPQEEHIADLKQHIAELEEGE